MAHVFRVIVTITLIILVQLLDPIFTSTHNNAQYHENLIVKPFLDGKVLLHFQFSTVQNHYDHQHDHQKHYTMFPKMLGQIVDRYHVSEMHLSLTQGRWEYDKWGNAWTPAPVGAELMTWFSAPLDHNAELAAANRTNEATTNKQKNYVEQNWKGLTNALSGLFCASLNFLDTTTEFSYAAGVVSEDNLFRYGTLSQETVCTENLTPFKQLLPSRAKAGIGALLNPIRLYDSHFHSMAVHYRRVNESCDELTQTVSIVFDIDVKQQQLDSNRVFKDFSLFSLLGYTSNVPSIPKFMLATESTIMLDVSSELQSYLLQNSDAGPNSAQQSMLRVSPESLLSTDGQQSRLSIAGDENHTLIEIDLLTQGISYIPNVEFKWASKNIPVPAKYQVLSAITAQRYESGSGQLDGGFVVHIQNNDPTNEISIQYYDAIPWYFKLYFHTLKMSINGQSIASPTQYCTDFRVTPSKDRLNSAVLQFVVSMPPRSNLSLSIEFEKAFLKYTEHSPDANRGFDLSSSVISYSLLTGNSNHSIHTLFDFCPLYKIRTNQVNNRSESLRIMTNTRVYTDSLLITLPKPDFSMPYNVITLSSTIIALFFGSLFNVLIRRFKFDGPANPPMNPTQ